MTANDSEAHAVRRKNRIVVITLLCGLVVPFLYIAFLAEHLPDWLDTVIVGGIFLVCFVEIIPANISAQHGPVIQKRRLARPAGVADLIRSAEEYVYRP